MRRHRRVVASALAAALSLFVVPPAFGASGVFGGSTSTGQAIVLRTDVKAKKVRSAVIAWDAKCTDGVYFSIGNEVTARANEPGFRFGPEDLVTTRNANGRFAGKQRAIWVTTDTQSAVGTVEVSGKFRGARASGKLRATVSILDATTGAEVTTCETGNLKWSASRAAGRIFGGSTSQDKPVVVRLDAKHRRVSDLYFGWESSTCEPPGYMSFGERFSGFTVRSRRFGDTTEQSFPLDDGGTIVYAYDVAGTVGRRSINGSLSVNVTRTNVGGVTDLTCDTGAVTWRASTG